MEEEKEASFSTLSRPSSNVSVDVSSARETVQEVSDGASRSSNRFAFPGSKQQEDIVDGIDFVSRKVIRRLRPWRRI